MIPNSRSSGVRLVDLGELLHPSYHRADQEPINQQARHRRLVVVAAVSGTLAVLGAIAQLTIEALDRAQTAFFSWAGRAEFLGVVLASIAVAVGVFLRFNHAWFFQRHKAELLRTAKFRL